MIPYRFFKIGCFILFMLYFFIDSNGGSSYGQEKGESATELDSSIVFLPSPKGAMIRSVIFPGWGQWYNDKKLKAGFVFLTEISIIGISIYWQNRSASTGDKIDKENCIDNRNLAFWYLGGAIFISMIDAYVDAHLAGFDVSPELDVMNDQLTIGLQINRKF